MKPSPQAIDALVVQIKRSGRAFGLFDVAKIVLAGRERYVVEFSSEPETEVPLFRCRVDGSVWLSKDQAMRHFLEQGNLEDVYLVENKEIEPPKGEFRSVAVCGGEDAQVLVYATFPGPDTAEHIGAELVEAGLAACVN
ncbi:MAG: hypothetical protein ABL994_09150, partial [Verrucomicrobiales bacterium]